MSFKIAIGERVHEVVILRRRPHLVLSIDGREHVVEDPGSLGAGRQSLVVDGARVEVVRVGSQERQIVRLDGRTHEVRHVDPFDQQGAGGAGLDVVRAPMPGAVVSVSKAEGDVVKRGETVATIESMKLQTALPAPRDGVIETIRRTAGQTFEKDEVIATLVAEAGAD